MTREEVKGWRQPVAVSESITDIAVAVAMVAGGAGFAGAPRTIPVKVTGASLATTTPGRVPT